MQKSRCCFPVRTLCLSHHPEPRPTGHTYIRTNFSSNAHYTLHHVVVVKSTISSTLTWPIDINSIKQISLWAVVLFLRSSLHFWWLISTWLAHYYGWGNTSHQHRSCSRHHFTATRPSTISFQNQINIRISIKSSSSSLVRLAQSFFLQRDYL